MEEIVIRKRSWIRVTFLPLTLFLILPAIEVLKILYELCIAASLWSLLFLPLILLMVAAAGICIFASFYLLYEMIAGTFRGDILLIVDRKGVRGYKGIMNIEYVPWKKVKRIYLNEIDGKKYIEFVFQDENKFLRCVSKKEKRKRKINRSAQHELIYLSLEEINMPAEEIFEKMHIIFEKTRQSLPYTIE